MEGLRDLLAPKRLHWFSYVANVFWILLGIILSGIFLDIEISEPRFDFRCGSDGDKELVRGRCYERYDKQYNKFPVYGFVIITFMVTAGVCGIYSQAVKSRVEELERDNNQDVENRTQQRNNNLTERKLFKAYCLQLLARVFLGIFFVLLQTILYPLSFPSNFKCNLTRDESFSDITASASRNENLTQTSYECHNQRAAKKTFWAIAVIVVTGSFAFLVFLECLYLLSRAKKVERFTVDPKFYKYYLSSNKPNPSTAEQEQELSSIEQMKKHVREVTKRPYKDLKSPFDDPGEGRDLKLDEIFTNLIVYKGRADYNFSGDRGEQLKEYHKANEKLSPTRPGEIFDSEEQKILVVGRPGIGKTMLSRKILRDWASDNLLNETQKSRIDFKVAFLVKLRMFNFTGKELNLRELLDHSEYSTTLSEETWSYIRENPKRVLIIFDGFDEYSRKAEINKDDVQYRNSEEDRMPVHFLLKKILSGNILTGATVLMTIRPNAVSCIRSPNFDKTVEILGFTTEQVVDYVEKFSKQRDIAETIKQHITSNSNLQAFCYIPVNCFIICSCLLELLGNTGFTSLPTRLTEIYSIAIKMFYFSYDDNQYRHDKAEGQQFFLKPFKELSSPVQEVFKRLGEIAFNGIKEGRLIFESHEVKDLESNGLFHRLPDTRERPLGERREQYCFLHLTMQEFLAAKYLVDAYSSEDLQKFVSDHIQYGAWRVVMQFVAGLLDEKEGKSTDIFSDLLPSKTDTKEVEIKFSEDSEERSETLTCWPADAEDKSLVVMLFNCMYENKASGRKVQEKLAEIGCNALNFSQCSLSPLDCLALVHVLKSVEGILYFDLSGNNLQSLGCIEIAKLLPSNEHNQGLCKLKRLNLGFNKITAEGVKPHLSTALTHTNCNLNSLDLMKNNITARGVKYLCIALTHTNCKLNSLNLSANDITDEGVERLSQALTHTNCKITSLDLMDNNITPKGIKHLSQALTHTNCKINSLDLHNNYINDKGVEHLSTALTHTNCKLTRLDLMDNKITPKGIKHLSKALTHNNCKLNSLSLDSNNITDNGVEHLSTALTHTYCKLNSLDLDSNIITDKGVQHLSTALTHTYCKLNSLNLSRNLITDESVKHLSTALTHTNCKLNSLDLDSNNITYKGVQHLSTALTHTYCKLNSLNLGRNLITDESVKHLSTALTQTNCKLNSLDLMKNNITDEGVKYLSRALTHTNCKLNSLNLALNKITQEGKNLLNSMNINCKVVF